MLGHLATSVLHWAARFHRLGGAGVARARDHQDGLRGGSLREAFSASGTHLSSERPARGCQALLKGLFPFVDSNRKIVKLGPLPQLHVGLSITALEVWERGVPAVEKGSADSQ